MKAHVDIRKPAMPVQNSSGILLTIGMIVKNEEKTLEECLQALQPLRDAIPCELIITDTGSADDTVEIAKRYADEVRFFTWTGDFAEARNTTIQNTRGDWYMYLDADEIFDESILEIADFFKSGKYLQYNSATHRIRNYANFQHTAYNDSYALRLQARTGSLKFKGKIHEYLDSIEPICRLDTVKSHHDGYVTLHVGELRKNKRDRNIGPILEEVKKNPNARSYRHLADCYSASILEDWEKKENALKKSIALAEKSNIFRAAATVELAYFYNTQSKLDEMRMLMERWFAQPHAETMGDCELHFLSAQNLMNCQQYEPAISHLKDFLRLYQKQAKTHDVAGAEYVVCHAATEQSEAEANALLAVCYGRLGETENAKKYMRIANPAESKGQNKKRILLKYLAIYCSLVEDVDYFKEVYQKIWEDAPEETQDLLEYLLMVFRAPSKERTKYLQRIAEKGDPEDPTAALAKIICKVPGINVKKEIDCILGNKDAVKNPIFADIIFVALDEPALADKVFQKLSAQQINAFVARAGVLYLKNFSRKVFHYICQSEETEDLRILSWRVKLLEHVVNTQNDYTDDEWWAMLTEYAKQGTRCCERIYSPAFWNEENDNLLSQEHAYILYLQKALQAKAAGDMAGYVKNLRYGLKTYEPMKNTSEYLLAQVTASIKKEENQKKKDLNEMEKLQVQVKENIRFLIEQDKKAEAAQLFRQYKQIAPEDADNEKIEALLLK